MAPLHVQSTFLSSVELRFTEFALEIFYLEVNSLDVNYLVYLGSKQSSTFCTWNISNQIFMHEKVVFSETAFGTNIFTTFFTREILNFFMHFSDVIDKVRF